MIDRVIEREVGRFPNGGYTNDPDDPGGETKWGISKRAYPTLNIKNLTREQATNVYYRDFLHGPRIDRIVNLALREQVFDFGVPSGPPRAIKTLQRLVHVEADGLLGPITLLAVNSHLTPVVLNNQLVDARVTFLNSLVEQRPRSAKYQRGWVNRARSFRL